jgi:hypothetical protein
MRWLCRLASWRLNHVATVLALGVIADETDSALSLYFGERPIGYKFMPEFVCALHTPKEVINGFVHAAVIDLSE